MVYIFIKPQKIVVSCLILCFCLLFSSGIRAEESTTTSIWQKEIPLLQSITALDADGNVLPLKSGEKMDIVTYPDRPTGSTGYLIIPDGAKTLKFTFVQTPPVMAGMGLTGEYGTTPRIRYRGEDGKFSEDIVSTSNGKNYILEVDVDKLPVDLESFPVNGYVDLYYEYTDLPGLMPPPGDPYRADFRIVRESTPNLYVQHLKTSGAPASRGETATLNLTGKTSEGQQMGLYYQYQENSEWKTELYAGNVSEGEINIDLTSNNLKLGDVTDKQLYNLIFFTKIENYESNHQGVAVLEPNGESIREIGLSQKTGTYTAASLWVNVGADFNRTVADSSKVEVFFSLDENGENKVEEVRGFDCTVAELPSVYKAGNCDYGKLKGLHIPSGMNPNTYYIIVKLTETGAAEDGSDKVTVEPIPFTVYKDAKAYVKAALDKTIEWYATNGNGGFVDKDGTYIGNTKETASGGSGLAWQAWIFPALGTEYPFDDRLENNYLFHKENNPEAQIPDTVDGKLSFAADGPFLSNQKTGDNPIKNEPTTTYEAYAEVAGAKSLAVSVISQAAEGLDPRDMGENDFNFLHELIRMGYKDLDIEAGEVNIDSKTGHLIVPPDGFAVAYTLSGLEICNATPEEGYTEEYRRAGIKTILDMLKSFNAGDTPLTPDTVGMISMPLYFMTDDEVYGEEIKAELAKVGETTKKGLYANGGIGDFVSDIYGKPANPKEWRGNTNSMAVMINTLVMAGNDAEEIGSWQKEYGTPLTAFIGSQRDIGDFGFPGAPSSWMATYQALGALVDLYNGKSSYAIAQEAYFNKYPMYTDEGDDLLKAMKCITDEVDTNEDVAEITAARASYDAFLKDLSEEQTATVKAYYDKVVNLEGQEGKAVGYVEKLINDLPPYDVVKPSDKAAAENAREAYDALSDAQQDKVKVDGNVYEHLLRVESQLNAIAAKNVETLMYALPDDDQITVFDRVEVEAARAAYDGLTEDQKAEVDGAAYGKLTAAERALLKLDAQDVVDAIDELPAVEDLKWTDKRFVEATRAAYDALTDKQKAYVTNVDKLEALEIRLAELADERPAAEDMKDLDKDAWYMDEVSWAIGEGFFNGDNNGNFNPNQYIKRAEFAQMLYNYYQNDADVMKNGKTVKYGDVAADAWYYEAVSACSKAGIFKGDTNGNFNPNAPISRQDAALVLMRIFIGEDAINAVDVDARLAELAEAGLKFADFDETSGYARKAMAAAAGFIFNGDQNGNLNPVSNITRAETATVLYNYFNTK